MAPWKSKGFKDRCLQGQLHILLTGESRISIADISVQVHQPQSYQDDVLYDILPSSSFLTLQEHLVTDWLSPLDLRQKQQDVYTDRQPGTGEWFLGSEDCKAWKEGEADVLWCYGIPERRLDMQIHRAIKASSPRVPIRLDVIGLQSRLADFKLIPQEFRPFAETMSKTYKPRPLRPQDSVAGTRSDIRDDRNTLIRTAVERM